MPKGHKTFGNYIGNNTSTFVGMISSLQSFYYPVALDGLSAATASTSAYNIKQDTGTTTDGLYWIKNSNINGGAPFQVYCDMNTNGGGWMLLVTSTGSGWTSSNVTSLNTGSPSVTSQYSILSWADYLKRSSTGFQYMVGASSSGTARANWTTNGAIVTVNQAYSFTSTSANNTDITAVQMLPGTGGLPTSLQTSGDTVSIGSRMPWLGSASSQPTALLTTYTGTGSWWGTLVQTDANRSSYNAGPWISAGLSNPTYIWYWMR